MQAFLEMRDLFSLQLVHPLSFVRPFIFTVLLHLHSCSFSFHPSERTIGHSISNTASGWVAPCMKSESWKTYPLMQDQWQSAANTSHEAVAARILKANTSERLISGWIMIPNPKHDLLWNSVLDMFPSNHFLPEVPHNIYSLSSFCSKNVAWKKSCSLVSLTSCEHLPPPPSIFLNFKE